MKKSSLIIIVILAFISNANGQDNITDAREIPTFGIKVGTNYSNVYDEQGDQFVADPKFGLATGIFVAIPFDKYIGLQPEILFSQKGFRATGVLLGNNYGLTRTTSYIDVPLYFALKPSEFFTLLAGPQFSYLVHQKDVVENGLTSYQQEQEFKNDNVRRNLLSFAGGFDITIKHAVLGARVAWDVQNNKGDGSSNTPRYKNVWYQFTIGYRIY